MNTPVELRNILLVQSRVDAAQLLCNDFASSDPLDFRDPD